MIFKNTTMISAYLIKIVLLIIKNNDPLVGAVEIADYVHACFALH